jgi:prolipoprotein diacylglyceryltransferase
MQHEALGLIQHGPSLAVVPTQLLEAGAALALCVAALRVERSLRKPGMLALWLLGAYAATRFCIEYLRAGHAILGSGLTGNQFVCVVLVLGGLALGLTLRLRRPEHPYANGAPLADP